MEITVDGQENVIEIDEETSLQDALEIINQRLGDYERAVQTFELDGQEAWENWQDQVGEDPISEFDSLDVESMSPRHFCVETIDELQGRFDTLQQQTEDATQHFRKGEREDGYELFQDVVLHLQRYIESVNSIVVLTGLDLDGKTVQGREIEAYVHDLRELINEAEPAIKEDDLDTLVDISGDQLAPLLEAWQDILELLQQDIQEEWAEPEEFQTLGE